MNNRGHQLKLTTLLLVAEVAAYLLLFDCDVTTALLIDTPTTRLQPFLHTRITSCSSPSTALFVNKPEGDQEQEAEVSLPPGRQGRIVEFKDYISEILSTHQHHVQIFKKTTQTKPVSSQGKSFRSRLRGLIRRALFRKVCSDNGNKSEAATATTTTRTTTVTTLDVTYDYDVLQIAAGNSNNPNQQQSSSTTTTTGIVLIHPIGVGISKWFYQRLFAALNAHNYDDGNSSNAGRNTEFVVLAPDLIGSGTATNITATIEDDSSSTPSNDKKNQPQHLPLLNISDWTDQLMDLMAKTESDYPHLNNWCIVANGGCSPIALQVAAKSKEDNSSNNDMMLEKPVTNIVLSSVPRLPFFLNATDPIKTAKSYKRLCGVLGNLFWWYACRKEGQFIQTFSEKNLVADPDNLGPYWRDDCYQTAISNDGASRYSTFAFLAGTLQDGCTSSLNTILNNQNRIRIDIIKGQDTRRNQAKSWFWQKKKRIRVEDKDNKISNTEKETKTYKTLRDYLQENGIEGNDYEVGGRISLAHEDAIGYSDAMMDCLLE